MDCNGGFVNNIKLYAQNDDAGRRLDRILRKALPGYPLSALHRLLRKGRVLVNGRPGKGEDRIPSGALIELPAKENETQLNNGKPALPKQPTALQDKSILWNGDGLFILDKPAGLAVHGGDGDQYNLDSMVKEYLKGKLPPSLSFKPGPLHRLDKPSSGIVVFALTLEAAKCFSKLLRKRKIQKRYLAILEGDLKKREIWEEMLARDKHIRKTFVPNGNSQSEAAPATLAPPAMPAYTIATPLARAKKNGMAYTLAQLEIVTGRTHQIRAHAAHHGHPLAGDRKYGGQNLRPESRGFFLHAVELELPNDKAVFPNIKRIIKSPPPEKFVMTVKELFGTMDL